MEAETILCIYPANLKAIIALIFFCFLFFYQEKKRERRVKAKATLIKMNAGTSPCITLPPHFGIQ